MKFARQIVFRRASIPVPYFSLSLVFFSSLSLSAIPTRRPNVVPRRSCVRGLPIYHSPRITTTFVDHRKIVSNSNYSRFVTRVLSGENSLIPPRSRATDSFEPNRIQSRYQFPPPSAPAHLRLRYFARPKTVKRNEE